MSSDSRSRYRRSHLIDNIMTGIIYVAALFALLILVGIIGHVFLQAARDFDPALFAFDNTGIGNQLFNTIYLVALSLFISVPLGISAGIYMAEYAGDTKLNRILRIAIETLSSLPSIVVGLFGYLAFIVLVGAQWNMVSGALALAILNLPLVTTVTEDALRGLSPTLREGSLGLGATPWQTIVRLLVPAAFPRIMTGIILAAGRSFGEAAALLYTAGMSTDINWSNWDLSSSTCPLNPFRPSETLALKIWSSRTEAIAPNAAQIANLSSATLLFLVLLFSIGARLLSRYLDKQQQGE